MPLFHISPLTVFAVVITTPQWPFGPTMIVGVAAICVLAIAFALAGERRHHKS